MLLERCKEFKHWLHSRCLGSYVSKVLTELWNDYESNIVGLERFLIQKLTK